MSTHNNLDSGGAGMAQNAAKLAGMIPVVINAKAAASGKIKMPGKSPVTGGATAVVLPASKSKVVFSTRKIGSDVMEVDFEAEVCLSDSPSDMVVDDPSGGKLTIYDLLELGYRQVDKTCASYGKSHAEAVTYYERHLAGIRLRVLYVDDTREEATEIQNDAYMQGDQVISRDPVGLFESLGINVVEERDDAYVLSDKPLVDVRKVVTEHCVLDHVRANDAVEAAGRCLEWRI